MIRFNDSNILSKATSKTWTQTLDTDLEKPRPILKPKPKPWTQNLKNLDPEKQGLTLESYIL